MIVRFVDIGGIIENHFKLSIHNVQLTNVCDIRYWCLTTLTTIFQLCLEEVLLVELTGVPIEVRQSVPG